MGSPFPTMMARPELRRLLLPVALILALIVIGTGGYVLLEHWSPGDALYMTIITLSTVGYREVHPLDGPGRAFTSLLILGGVSTLAYGLTTITRSVVEGEMSGRVLRQQLQRRIRDLRGHVVVCGFGRVGAALAEQLRQEGIPLIVVEQNPERFGDCLRERYLAVLGDATRDEVLSEAGIERARGLAIALDDDAKNVFIALTGRALNAGIYIVSRAGLPESEAKLLHAGVDRVVSPYSISGRRMAALMTRPRVVDIVETALQPGGIEHGIEEFTLPDHSRFVGHTLADLDLRAATGAIVLAVIDTRGKISSSPANGYQLQPGDSLVAIGTQPELRRLEGMAGDG